MHRALLWATLAIAAWFAPTRAAETASETPAAPAVDDVSPAVPVVMLLPEHPAEQATRRDGTVVVSFKLDPGELGPVEIFRVESDLPDEYYLSVKQALQHWRFRPGSNPRSCISRIQRAAMTVRFHLSGFVEVESLVMNAREVFIPPEFFANSVERAVEEGKALERLVEPIEYAPDYPWKALRNGVSGYVVVHLLLDKEGRARNPHVVHARPPEYFEKATLKALKKARFQPPDVPFEGEGVSTCFIARYSIYRVYR